MSITSRLQSQIFLLPGRHLSSMTRSSWAGRLAVVSLVCLNIAAAQPSEAEPLVERQNSGTPSEPSPRSGTFDRFARNAGFNEPASPGGLPDAVEESPMEPAAPQATNLDGQMWGLSNKEIFSSVTPSYPAQVKKLLQQLTTKAQSKGLSQQQLIDIIMPRKDKRPVQIPKLKRAVVSPTPGDIAIDIEKVEACADVPTSVQGTCTLKRIKQNEFPCPLNFFAEVCALAERTYESSCPVTVERLITYECPKPSTKQVCYQQPRVAEGMCVGVASQAVETPCQRTHLETVCTIQDRTVEATCHETKEVEREYSCKKVEAIEVCSTEVVSVPQKCKRQVQVPVLFDYQDMQEKVECRTVKKRVPKQCNKENLITEKYPCPKTIVENECKTVLKPVKTACPKDLSGSVGKGGDYRGSYPGVLNRRLKKTFWPIPTPPAPATERQIPQPSLSAPKPVLGVKAAPCTRMEATQECKQVEKVLEKICDREVVKTVTEDCSTFVDEEECTRVKVPVTKPGARYEVKEETYDCTTTTNQEKCVETLNLGESTCSATLMETVEKPCTQTLREQVCEERRVPTNALCAKVEEVEFEYACKKVIFEEKCETAPTYELGECEMALRETVMKPCSKTYRQTECQQNAEPEMGTCFEEKVIEVEDTCSSIEIKPTCVPAIISRAGTRSGVPLPRKGKALGSGQRKAGAP